MAAIPPTVYADDIEANIPPLYAPLKPNRLHGRVRVATWRWTCASEVSGTVVAVAKLPKGARLISGAIAASATLANSATLAVGLSAVDGSGVIHPAAAAGFGPDDVAVTADVADSSTALKAAAAQGTTLVSFLLTRALGYTYELQKECWLILTTGTGTISTEIVMGHVLYVVD